MITPFTASCNLRQDDPLRPLLYNILSDLFLRLVHKDNLFNGYSFQRNTKNITLHMVRSHFI